jgi:hypothetical protein
MSNCGVVIEKEEEHIWLEEKQAIVGEGGYLTTFHSNPQATRA